MGFTTDIPIDGSTWLAARAVSAVRLPYNQDLPLFAHTSPIYVDVPSRPISSPEDAAYFAEQCALAIEWAKSTAKVLDESQREEMIELYEEALHISRSIGNKRGESYALGNLGLAHAMLGDAPRALGFFHQDLRLVREIEDERGEATVLGKMGIVICHTGPRPEASPLHGRPGRREGRR